MSPLLSQVPICVDGRMLRDGGTGVSTYARSLLDAVEGVGGRPYLLSATQERGGRLGRWLGAANLAVRRVAVDAAGGAAVGQITGRDIFRRAHVHFGLYGRLMRIACDLGPGVMHWTYPVPIIMQGWSNLYTVHDAIPLVRPDLTPVSQRRHKAVMAAIGAEADRLVTVSEAARRDIIEALRCDPDLVVNCGQPVDVRGERATSTHHGFGRKGYLLFCGAVEPRKNLSALLQAYRHSGVEEPIVLVGPDGWRVAEIRREIERTPGAVRLPYVSRAELLGLIEGAKALLFPSLAEGFGLPVAEAMALGTPVLTSDRGALAEIAGGAALLVDPEDIAAIAAGIRRMTSDEAFAESLSELGRIRARAFSRDLFVERLTKIYQATFADRRNRGYQGAG